MEPILPRASIEASACAAATNNCQHIDITNPHPADTAAHALWELSYELALNECEGHLCMSVC
jgi:hypothetical protein